ncbi:fungal specific transcription factor [Penicillium vulpinum]|uniref:Fungal-type protein kinase domain-containing protein n=1 Tax=Penicillium vulpinum TaxID=29845 RepID=A0A1V6RY22_9EURO|nr:fungal specific transcription factor [Penicillium vulpinum]KAJ5951405.1 fungal specific transcription factor [Penicillium vulpinum]OQE06556.1 hypothetical protein PENVUL_c017G09565 [Penicillium vulpinum]
MRFSSMLVAISFTFLSTLYQQTIGGFLPIKFSPTVHQQTVIDDTQHFSCTKLPRISRTERTEFDTGGCVVYGYPSTGGVLIKEASLLDMLFLSLPRSHASQRSSSADEEDSFCDLMRRTGAKLWRSQEDWLGAMIGMRDFTEEEEKVLVFGWPTDGVGVWVLRFTSTQELPRNFGRISLAMNMEEKIQMMKEYNATFVEDVTQVEELSG